MSARALSIMNQVAHILTMAVFAGQKINCTVECGPPITSKKNLPSKRAYEVRIKVA